MYFMHGLFLTCTQKSHLYYMTSILVFTSSLSLKSPFINKESPLYLFGGPASCLRWRIPIYSGPHCPPLCFYPFLTTQFTLHYLHRRHQQSRSSSSGTILYSTTHCMFPRSEESFPMWQISIRFRKSGAQFGDQLFYTLRLTSDIFALF